MFNVNAGEKYFSSKQLFSLTIHATIRLSRSGNLVARNTASARYFAQEKTKQQASRTWSYIDSLINGIYTA